MEIRKRGNKKHNKVKKVAALGNEQICQKIVIAKNIKEFGKNSSLFHQDFTFDV